MSELSRMHRHQGRNNKGRKDRESAQSLGRRTSTQPGLTDEEWSRTPTSTPAKEVPRRSREASDGLSRSRTSTAGRTSWDEEDEFAPKRTDTYSSYRVRMSKWFVNSLIIIFILLMAGLLWWGLNGAPPLKELLKEIL